MADQITLVSAFVEFRVLEGQGKGTQALTHALRCERADDRRIEASGKIGSDRNVGAQLQSHGVAQQVVQLVGAAIFREIVRRCPGGNSETPSNTLAGARVDQ